MWILERSRRAWHFFQLLHSEEGLKKCPQVRYFLLLSQYTQDKLKASSGGGPGVSQFLEANQITSFVKKPDQVAALEKTIRELKTKYLPFLVPALGERTAALEFAVYMDLVIRCLFSKQWPADLNPKVSLPVGKFSQEKVKALGVHWAVHSAVHWAVPWAVH